LGPGLLEAAYQACLCYELRQAGLQVEAKTRIPFVYKGIRIECAYEADIIINDAVIVEVKALESLASIHIRQLFTYLTITDRRVGLLLNFGAMRMKDGIKRVVHQFPED
jgi:GxxExxY protein